MSVSLHLSPPPFTLPTHPNRICFRIVGKISLMTWKSCWVSFDGSINLCVRHSFIGYILTERGIFMKCKSDHLLLLKTIQWLILAFKIQNKYLWLACSFDFCQLAWRFKVILSLLILKYEFWYFIGWGWMNYVCGEEICIISGSLATPTKPNVIIIFDLFITSIWMLCFMKNS